jgi:RNA polymerase sigma-70 factor, ECF subfamily
MQQDQLRYINGLKAGEKKVFDTLFNALYEPLCRYCMRMVPDQQEAEEIVQDIFVNLWLKRSELNIDVSLKAYLFRTVMNRAINYNNHQKVRKNYHAHVVSENTVLHNEPDKLVETELTALYETVVASMPQKRKEVFELSRKEGLKYTEIAEHMGISVKTVEAHLSKALEELRIRLQEYLPLVVAFTALTVDFFLNNTGYIQS